MRPDPGTKTAVDAQRSELTRLIREVCQLETAAEQAFVELFQPRSMKKGEDIIREGEIASQIGFVQSGVVRSYYLSRQGAEYNKHFFIEGSFFAPLTSLVTSQPSPVYIGALTDVELLLADHPSLEVLYEKYVELNRLGRKLTELAWIGKERRETQLIMLDATARYRVFLEEFPGLAERIPQYHIASYLGISPVQLSRIRSQLAG